MKQTFLVALTALLLAAGMASAQDDLGNSTVEGVADDGTSLLDEIVDGVDSAVDGVGDVAKEIGQGVGTAASATLGFLGTVILGTLEGLAQGGAAIAQGLSVAFLSAFQGMGLIGAALTTALLVALQGVGTAFAFLGGQLAALSALYWGFVGSLRPDAMPFAAFAAITYGGAATSTAAGGWAGWQALRKWGLIGSGLGGVAGFSRINDSDLLEHPMRGDLFRTIQASPGIHASQLARELDVGWGTITHHLDKLSRAKLITSRKVNNQKCFFEQGGNVSREDMAVASALKGETASGIAQFVQSNPMTSQKQMAEALDISPALASFHVKKLVALGVLEKMRHGKETLLSTSDGLRRVMLSQDPVVAQSLQESGFEYSS